MKRQPTIISQSKTRRILMGSKLQTKTALEVYNLRTYERKGLGDCGQEFRDICSQLKKILLSHVVGPHMTVMDVACGQACDIKKVGVASNWEAIYVGLDGSETAIKEGIHRSRVITKMEWELHVFNVDDSKMPWPGPPSVDVMLCCNAIHYFQNRVRFWDECRSRRAHSVVLWHVDADALNRNANFLTDHPWFQLQQPLDSESTGSSYRVRLPGVVDEFVTERKIFTSEMDTEAKMAGFTLGKRRSLIDMLQLWNTHHLVKGFHSKVIDDPMLRVLCEIYVVSLYEK